MSQKSRYRRRLLQYELHCLQRRLRRINKVKREQTAGALGLLAVLFGMITWGLEISPTIPKILCLGGAVTLGITHHFSRKDG